ncbi:FYN-binding protein-like [Blomia tropicalis]|nr:FYN-binding protein-like [Blomia tropicalis]
METTTSERDEVEHRSTIIRLPLNLDKIRQLFQNQKLLLNALQPHNRSFSQPELRPDLINQFKSFHENWLEDERPIRKNTTTNGDGKETESDDSIPPIPKPRRSVLERRQHRQELQTQPNETIYSCDTPVVDKDETITIVTNSTIRPNTESPLPSIEENETSSTAPLSPTLSQKNVSEEYESPQIKMPIKIKTKNSFRQLLRINKIVTANKFSIRLKDSLSRKKSKLFMMTMNGWASQEQTVYKPRRPTREPPLPPILIFRPAAPLPDEAEKCQEKVPTIIASTNNNTGLCMNLPKVQNGTINNYDDSVEYDDNISELYHDACNNGDDNESLYCSVDEIGLSTDDGKIKTTISENIHCGGCNIEQVKSADDEYGDGDDYYDDGECIYEELSSNDGTIYEEYFDDSDENVYDNADVVQQLTNGSSKDFQEQEKKQMKRLKKIQKMMKRFHLSGDEIPINAGIVKNDQKGSKTELLVRQGETVLILRMDNNPPGKWLAKNERSKIGYVNLDNVCIETESIKAAIKSFHNIS